MRLSRRAWWLYLALMAPVAGAYLAGPSTGPVYNAIGFSGFAAMVVGMRMHRPSARWAWYVLAIAEVLFVAGDVLAYNYPALFGEALPSTSVADVFYLSVYPVTVAGLLLLIRRRNPGRDWASLIDAAIVTIGLALLSWVFLISPLAPTARCRWERSWSRSPIRSRTSSCSASRCAWPSAQAGAAPPTT